MIHVVLYRPEIALNVGNIMRTCAALGAKLHIIGPLPFRLDDERLKRSGMDYVASLDYDYYENYAAFAKEYRDENIYYATRYGSKSPDKCDFHRIEEDYYLMFGRESTGIPKEILKKYSSKCFRIPMTPFARALNLANSVAIALYEATRQQEFNGLATRDNLKDDDYLK